MPCLVNAGSGKRQIRGSAVTPRGLPDCHSPQGTQSRTYQLRRSYSPRQHMIPVRASSAPIISRPHSARRPFCFLSLSAFISFFSAPFLAAVKGNGQRAEVISRGREIEGAREELQLAETMKKGSVWGSAKKMYSVSPVDYRLLEEVGHGASGTVYRAMYMPCNEVVAVKCLDLDRCNSNLFIDGEDIAEAKEDDAEAKEDDGSSRNFINNKCELGPSTSRFTSEKPLTADKNSDRQNQRDAQWPDGGGLIKKSEYQETDLLEVSNQDVIYRYDKVRLNDHSEPSTSMHDAEPRWKNQVGKKPQLCSGPILPSSVQNNSSERGWTFERAEGENQLPTERSRCDALKAPNLSGPVMLPNRASANRYSDSSEDKSMVKVVQIKGRFSVTSENVAIVKGSPLTRSATVGDWLFNSKQVPVNQLPKENINISLPASILIPHLQNLFQQTTFQQDLLKLCLNSMHQIDLVSGIASQTFKPGNDVLVTSPDIERESLLLVKISELQARMISLIDELIAARLKNNQLQQQLITAYSKKMEKRFDFQIQ